MRLFNIIQNYKPKNQQEEYDKEQMLQFMKNNENYLERENQVGHFTASMWVVNKERTKTLMVYHNLYDSWSWIGGHADGMENLCEVALKELREETGVESARLISEDVFSLETLAVNGYMRKGIWILSHLHFNLTFLAEAEEAEELTVQEEENSAVHWWNFEETLKVSTEQWMIENIYKKLIEGVRNM